MVLSVEAGAYPFDIKVILIGVLVTITLYIVTSYLTAKWFEKRRFNYAKFYKLYKDRFL